MLLFRKKLVLTPKQDGGLRPIAVMDALGRILSIGANRKGIEYIGDSLQPHQFGLGMASGCQMNYMHTDMVFNKGDTVASVDQTNAFNRLRNRKVYDGLKRWCPGLIAFFRQQIHVSQIIENHVGAIMGFSHMAPTQGDGCGSLFFCLGTQELNIEIYDGVKLIENEYRIMNPNVEVSESKVKAIIDDVTINGHPEVMAIFISTLPAIYARNQMEVNISKTVVTGLNLDMATTPIPDGFRVSHRGLKTVGGWAGTNEAKNDFYEKMLDTWAPPLESYKFLSPQGIMEILRKSHINKPNYLFSLGKDMSMIQVHAKRYDGYTTKIISQAFTLPDLAGHLNININNANNFHNDTVTMEKLIFLPSKQGGVGMTKHDGITTENSITTNLIKYRQLLAS
jgi:hypothetical protein